ncbi:MAG: transcription antitermination factor NusB [Lachnospiraceae bacterium]|nr:transcription antitermination factor NusB [Lachnospiraceae bacterium]
MYRREAREHVFKLVFLKDFYKDEDYVRQCGLYLDQFPELSEDDRREVLEKAEAVFLRSEEIDEMLNRLSEGWKTKRMNRVDLSLLRLAVYEIRYDDSIPEKVAVNEAVELAKTFGGEDSPAFVNAILGKIMREQ